MKTKLWTGRILSGLAIAFLLMDAGMKLAMVPMALEANAELGYPASVIFPLGLLELALLAVYVVPQTWVLGAVLWTGYLGGAIATHVRVGNTLLTHTLFPIWIALFLWGGIWLRDEKLRAVFPLRAND